MTVNIAWGSLAAWNALRQDQRDWFNGGHYLSLGLAVAALPGVPAEDYLLRAISDTLNSSIVNLPSSFNNKILVIDGGFYEYNSTYANYNIQDYVVGGTVVIKNFKYVSMNDKGLDFQSFIILRHNGLGKKYIHSNIVNLNGYISNFLFLYQGLDNTYVYNNTVYNPSGLANYGGVWVNATYTHQVDIFNNTFYNCPKAIRTSLANCVYKNNNFTGCTIGIEGIYTDQGGNATSDATGSPGYQNILATDAMFDPANGKYRPIKNGPLLLSDRTYAGAIQLTKKRIKPNIIYGPSV